MNSFRVFRSWGRPLLSSLLKEQWGAISLELGDQSRKAEFASPRQSTENFNGSAAFAARPTLRWCEPRSSCWHTSTRSGVTRRLPGRWAVPIGRCASGAAGAGRGRWSGTRPGRAGRVFFFSLGGPRASDGPRLHAARDSGKPLSRWSAADLARAVIDRGIVPSISASTVKRWLQADQIKPWQYRSWQHPTDPCQGSPHSEPPGSGKQSHPGSPIWSQAGSPMLSHPGAGIVSHPAGRDRISFAYPQPPCVAVGNKFVAGGDARGWTEESGDRHSRVASPSAVGRA